MERCERCDREECPRWPFFGGFTPRDVEWLDPGCIRNAVEDCAAHAVDWRTRAIAAESREAELRAALVEACDAIDHAMTDINGTLHRRRASQDKIAESCARLRTLASKAP